MNLTNAVRTVIEGEGVCAATPAQVFPLLCPVREYEWIDGWSCELVYSSSGIAESGCVFRHEGNWGVETWTVSRYEPDAAISFVVVLDTIMVVMLDLTLEPVGATSTTLRTRFTLTALGAEGARLIQGPAGEWYRSIPQTQDKLINHYLTTGTAMPMPI